MTWPNKNTKIYIQPRGLEAVMIVMSTPKKTLRFKWKQHCFGFRSTDTPGAHWKSISPQMSFSTKLFVLCGHILEPSRQHLIKSLERGCTALFLSHTHTRVDGAEARWLALYLGTFKEHDSLSPISIPSLASNYTVIIPQFRFLLRKGLKKGQILGVLPVQSQKTNFCLSLGVFGKQMPM